MPDATHLAETGDADWRDRAYDVIRGIATYRDSVLVGNLARAIANHPGADIAVAFNRKQVASKMWARDKLHESCGGRHGRIWIVGGWYGVFAAMLSEDRRFEIAAIDSFDIDPAAAAVAATLNRGLPGRFNATTADMYALDYAAAAPELVVNTSCEHIADLRGWLRLIPSGTRVLLQSNDYVAEPGHVNCMPSLSAFAQAAALPELLYAGELASKRYTRFMLIGRA